MGSEKKEKDSHLKEEKPIVNNKEMQALDQRKLFKEGQRFLTPPVADATRAFYESLLAENPESKLAIRFAVEYGLLDREKHNKVLKKYLHLKEKGAYDARVLIQKALDKQGRKEKREDKLDKEERKEKKE